MIFKTIGTALGHPLLLLKISKNIEKTRLIGLSFGVTNVRDPCAVFSYS